MRSDLAGPGAVHLGVWGGSGAEALECRAEAGRNPFRSGPRGLKAAFSFGFSQGRPHGFFGSRAGACFARSYAAARVFRLRSSYSWSLITP